MTTWRKSIPSLVLWVVWLATRTALYLPATAPSRIGDVGIYQKWYTCCFSHGTFPVADPMWQYPPGAGLVLWLPGRLPGSYVDDFALLATGCDLAVTIILYAASRRGGSPAGVWYWVCGVPVLGALAVGRLDMIPVMLSVAALCAAGRGGVRGVLLAAATAVKAWPVTLLAGTAPGQWRRVSAALVAVLAPPVLSSRADDELSRAPGCARRRGRIGRRGAVHDLAARRLARDSRLQVRRVAAQRRVRRARAGRVETGPDPHRGGRGGWCVLTARGRTGGGRSSRPTRRWP